MRAPCLPVLTGLVVLVWPGAAEDAYYPPPDLPALHLTAESPPSRGYGAPAPPADFRYHGHSPGDHGSLPSRYTSASPLFRNPGSSADGDGYIVEGIPTPGGSPGGFGVPPPGPIPPIPPPVNPLIPPGPCSPAGYIWMRLYTLVEPITVLVIGVSIFVVVKHLVIPYMLYIARTAMFVDYDKEDRSLMHPVTARLVEAATKGLCLERISCNLGKMSRDYMLTQAVLSAIEDSEQVPKLFSVFGDAASGRQDSCEQYTCFRKPSSSSTTQVKKQSHWKRKSITSNHIRK